MALSTAITTLMYTTDLVAPYDTPALSKLVDIVSYPDMGGSPNKLDTTDLTATTMKTNILGLQEATDLTFECNYDEAKYNTIVGLTATYHFELQLGTAGADGKFSWDGQIRCYLNGSGVDEVRKMTVVCSASTAITFAQG